MSLGNFIIADFILESKSIDDKWKSWFDIYPIFEVDVLHIHYD